MTLHFHYFETILSHWGRVTHICVGNLAIVGSDKSFAPTIIWTNAGIFSIWHLGTNFNKICKWNYNIFIQENTFECVVCKMVSILSRLQCVEQFDSQRFDPGRSEVEVPPCMTPLTWSLWTRHIKVPPFLRAQLERYSCGNLCVKDVNEHTSSL